MSSYGADVPAEVTELSFEAIRDELVALSQVRVADRGDDLAEPTRRAAELLNRLQSCTSQHRWQVFRQLTDTAASYEEGNGTSARNPVLDAIAARVLESGYFAGENETAISIIVRGGYPIQLNDIIAFGIDEIAPLIGPTGSREAHFLTDVGAMTMVLEGRWGRPDGRDIRLDVNTHSALRHLRDRVQVAEVADADKSALSRLLAVIDVVTAVGRVVPVVTNDRA